MDDFAKMMILAGKGMYSGTKMMASGFLGTLKKLSGNTPDKRNRDKRGIIEYQPSEIGGFFPSNKEVENMVVSGGTEKIRAEAIGAYCMFAAYKGLPVIVLHGADKVLEQYMENIFSGTGLLDIVNQNNPVYEPFWKKDGHEISQMIVESAPKELEMKVNVRSYLDGMCNYLQGKKISPNYKLMATCPHGQLFFKIDEAEQKGQMSAALARQIKMCLMAGQNEYFKIENYFYSLEMQIESILWKCQNTNQAKPVNILGTIGHNGVLMIDIGTVSNQILINLLLAEIRLAVQKGKGVACVLDALDVSDNEYLKRMIEQNSGRYRLAFVSGDIFASCNAEDQIFNVVLGKSMKNIIFSHGSNISATKWADAIGFYDKEDVSYSYSKGKNSSPTQLFASVSNSESTNISMKREYILKPETILRMGAREAYIYTKELNELAHTTLI